METLISSYVPDYAQYVADFVISLGQFFAGGVLIAFLAWVVGYTARALMGLVEQAAGKD